MRRRTTLTVLGAVALLVPLAAVDGATAADDAGPSRAPRPDTTHETFLSRPGLAAEAPALSTIRTGKEDPRPLLTTPGTTAQGGIGIYDNSGQLIYWKDGKYADLKAATYRGEPVLSVFSATSGGDGKYVLLDSSYRQVAEFAMKGYTTDPHDFQVSPDGKRVLLLSYHPVKKDLSEYGGPKDATVTDAVVQEQDIETGEVTFEWSALDHIPLTETQVRLDEKEVDYVHFNSLAYEKDGTLLASARHSSTVYKIDMADGKIKWRLGGENSDFALPGLGDAFSFQHDARRLKDGSISVFDNGNLANPQRSRGAVYTLDEAKKTATLTRDLQPDPPQYGSYVGSNNEMANGDQLVSYGNTGEIAEFQGEAPVWAGAFPENYLTYRAQRADWKGTPSSRPSAVLRGDRLAMSWNGSTEVRRWRVEVSGERAKEVKRTGFETRTRISGSPEKVRITALDAKGNPLQTRTATSP
ncbi:arylsulfotransferase family protein [Streptomyces sp. NPDC048172]|uniref:arylsulfotransferase family protein n=1 Tax=Streptomyces sp. NPDC048172 TaxID=3365505 RepID=UPI0037195EAA